MTIILKYCDSYIKVVSISINSIDDEADIFNVQINTSYLNYRLEQWFEKYGLGALSGPQDTFQRFHEVK